MNFFDLFSKNSTNKMEEEKKNNKNNNVESQPAHKVEKDGKAHIYNLIIVDESGSMGHLCNATISGVNETINTIRQAQKDFADQQTHFLTLVTFDSPGQNGKAVRTIIDTKPIGEVEDFKNYAPYGGTPLYDAMGLSISRLYQMVKDDEDASAIVTVMTDGLENTSREYSLQMLKKLIERLKEEGWTFNYMGSAHDVQAVTRDLSIENVVEFSHDEEGTNETWRRERMSKRRMFEMMSQEWDSVKNQSADEKREYRKSKSKGFYDGV